MAALVERAYAPWVPIIGRRPAPMDDDDAARCDAGQALLLDREGRLAGLLVLVPAADRLWIDNVAIEPPLAGQGLGRALMAAAEQEARRLGLPELRLLTNALMASNIALYHRLGFIETDRRGEHGFSRVFMARLL